MERNLFTLAKMKKEKEDIYKVRKKTEKKQKKKFKNEYKKDKDLL